MEYLRNDNILTISTSYSSDRGVCTCGEKNFGYDDGLWCCKSSQGYCTTDKTTSPSKEAGLVIYLAFLAKVANLYYMILTAFKKYWPDTVAKFTSGTQDRFI